ncbi:hypothetical protein ES703_28874 [subsurface metagenome]
MAADFTYDGTKIVVCNGIEGAPKTFAEMHDADLAGTRSLHDRNGVNAVDGADVAVDHALQPADQLVLGGAVGQDLYFVITNWTNMVSANLYIIGTAADGEYEIVNQTITGNGTYYTPSFFKTVTHTKIWGFDSSDAGSFDYEFIQGRWGVVWEIIENGQYKIDCNIDFGNIPDATYFQSKNEMVYFADGKVPVIKDYATLEIGDASGDWSFKGSCWSLKVENTYDMIETDADTAVFKTYGSLLIQRDASNQYTRFYGGTWIARNFVYSGVGEGAAGNSLEVKTMFVDWKDVRLLYVRRFVSRVTPTNFSNVHIHDCDYSIYAYASVTMTEALVTDAATAELLIANAADITLTLENPKFHPNVAKMIIYHATGVVKEQYTCDVHVTDKDGADLAAVDVHCDYAHLVEGSDNKTYKCVQDHTAVDATHKPVTGTNWNEYWVLYDAGGGLGGDWVTGFAYKASVALFPAVTTNGGGDISQQVIQYKAWNGITERLEARIHTFTFSHASYPDFVMSDIMIDHPLVWEFDMGQSTSDLETIVSGRLATYDSPTRAEATADKDAIITEVDANEAKIDTVDGNVDSVKAKTDNLPVDPADASVIDAQLVAIAGYIDTEVAAIKAKTDNLPASPAPASEYDVEMARVTANVATEAKQDTAQADLDIVTGADGVEIATDALDAAAVKADAVTEIQSGVATEAKQDTAQADLDKLTGADGATLASAQGNYAPAKTGDEMKLEDDAIKAAKYDESTAFPVSQKASQAASTIVIGAVVADGGNSTTQFKTNLTEVTNDHYNGRVVLWVTGALTGQATDVTDYDGVNKILLVTAMTEIPAPTDTFVLV